MRSEDNRSEFRMMKIRDVLGPARNIFINLSDAAVRSKTNRSISQGLRTHRQLGLGQPQLGVKTMSTQPQLPHLPVPPLQETLDRYLKTVKPLITNEEFAVTTNLAKDFAASGGIGDKLQKLLEERARTKENWLSEWWLNSAYLDFRWPVVVYSSPGLVFPLQKFTSPSQQLAFAAKLISGAIDYKLLIDQHQIPIEKMGKDFLDMSQYYKIFGTCRVPGVTRDELSFLDPSNPARHIIVMHNNHVFKVNVFGAQGEPLNETQILSQLEELVEKSMHPATPVGILSSENRNVWGKVYQKLSKDEVNRHSLQEIKTGLFVVCLDNKSLAYLHPDNRETSAALRMVHGGGSKGNGGNRWFDKTVQFVIGVEGDVGLTYEHSPAEGPPIATLMDHIVTYVEKNKTNRLAAVKTDHPEPLKFVISTEIENTIQVAEQNLDNLVDDLQMSCFTFSSFGKDFIKSQKVSPDSFIQMAIQLAFYRIHSEPGAHYESASARKFLHGRTETIRSCSIESAQFAQTMLSDGVSDVDKKNALVQAINAHKDYTIGAINGRGVDRHLLGLKLTAIEKGMDVPKLFLDTGYIRSSHFRISTSQVAAKCHSFMCYGPLVPDGYACCYNPRDKEMVFGVSAFRSSPETDAVKFHKALEMSLMDMHNVLLRAGVKSKL